jgi:hypothetical protein
VRRANRSYEVESLRRGRQSPHRGISFFGRDVWSGMTGMTTAQGASSPQSKLLQRPSLVLALMGQTRLPGLVAENVSLSLQDNPSSNGASPLVHSRIQLVLLRNRTDVCVKCLALSTFRPSAETGRTGRFYAPRVALHDFLQEKKC